MSLSSTLLTSNQQSTPPEQKLESKNHDMLVTSNNIGPWQLDKHPLESPVVAITFPKEHFIRLFKMKFKQDYSFEIRVSGHYSADKGKANDFNARVKKVFPAAFKGSPEIDEFSIVIKVASKQEVERLFINDVLTEPSLCDTIAKALLFIDDLKEYTKASKVLATVHFSHLNSNRKVGEIQCYYTDEYHQQVFDKAIKEAVQNELVEFFKRRIEFTDLGIKQRAITQACKLGKLSIVQLLAKDRVSFNPEQIKLSLQSDNLDLITWIAPSFRDDNPAFQHALLLYSAKNKSNYNLLLTLSPDLKSHDDIKSELCSSCTPDRNRRQDSAKALILEEISHNGSVEAVKHYLNHIECIPEDYINQAIRSSGISMVMLLNHHRYPQETDWLLLVKNQDKSVVAYLIKQFRQPIASKDFYREIVEIINQLNPTFKDLCQFIDNNEVAAIDVLIHYNSDFYPDTAMFQKLFKRYPHTLNESTESETLLFNKHINLYNHIPSWNKIKFLLEQGADEVSLMNSMSMSLGRRGNILHRYIEERRTALLIAFFNSSITPNNLALSAIIFSYMDEPIESLRFSQEEKEPYERLIQNNIQILLSDPENKVAMNTVIRSSNVAPLAAAKQLTENISRSDYSFHYSINNYLMNKSKTSNIIRIAQILKENGVATLQPFSSEIIEQVKNQEREIDEISLNKVIKPLFEGIQISSDKLKELVQIAHKATPSIIRKVLEEIIESNISSISSTALTFFKQQDEQKILNRYFEIENVLKECKIEPTEKTLALIASLNVRSVTMQKPSQGALRTPNVITNNNNTQTSSLDLPQATKRRCQ